MYSSEFLKNIHIGGIIRSEMDKHRLTDVMLADKMCLTKWDVRKVFQQESIKINRLIKFSYALEVNLLHVYLRKMPAFGSAKPCEDEIIININNGQASITPSKKSRTTDFLQSIHIGKLLQAEAKKQNMQEDILAEIICRERSAVSRMFSNPDIDTERLILMSYALNYNFLQNIYLPYMMVNENEIIANDCISDSCIIKFNPKIISVVIEKQILFYQRIGLSE